MPREAITIHGQGLCQLSDPQPNVLTSRPVTRKRRCGVERTELHGDILNRALDEAIAS